MSYGFSERSNSDLGDTFIRNGYTIREIGWVKYAQFIKFLNEKNIVTYCIYNGYVRKENGDKTPLEIGDKVNITWSEVSKQYHPKHSSNTLKVGDKIVIITDTPKYIDEKAFIVHCCEVIKHDRSYDTTFVSNVIVYDTMVIEHIVDRVFDTLEPNRYIFRERVPKEINGYFKSISDRFKKIIKFIKDNS